MTIRFLKRLSLAVAVGVVPWALVGCGEGQVVTTVPANPPPIPTDEKGKPMPPPTAATSTPAKR